MVELWTVMHRARKHAYFVCLQRFCADAHRLTMKAIPKPLPCERGGGKHPLRLHEGCMLQATTALLSYTL